jgi:hypothetical protein
MKAKAKQRKDLGNIFNKTVEPEQPEVAVQEPEKQPAPKRRDRIGKKSQVFQLSEPAKKQLAIMAVEVEKNQQTLMIEATNDLFTKYGRPPIA